MKMMKKLWEILGRKSTEVAKSLDRMLGQLDDAPRPLHTGANLETQARLHISKSGCGCSRYGARDFFDQNNGGRTPEQLLELYDIVSKYGLHSYCNSTGSSYTSSNVKIVKRAFDAANIAIPRATGSERDRIVRGVYPGVVNDLLNDSSRYNFANLTSDDVRRVVEVAASLASKDDHSNAIRVLDCAKILTKYPLEKGASGIFTAQALTDMIGQIMQDYRPQAVSEIAHKDMDAGKKILEIRRIVQIAGPGRLLEKVNVWANDYHDRYKSMPVVQEVASSVTDFYGRGIKSAKPELERLTEAADREISKIQHAKDKRNTVYEQQLSAISKFQSSTNSEELRNQLDKRIGAVKSEYATLTEKLNQDLNAASESKQKAIAPFQEKIADLEQERGAVLSRINERSMGRDEYKSLSHTIREANREQRGKVKKEQ